MKSRLLHPVLVFMPFLILIAAFGLDMLKAQVGRKYGPVNTETYIWSLVWIRMVFALVVFSGITILGRTKKTTLFDCILWLVLGFTTVFLATPWGNYLRSYLIHNPIFATIPNRMFSMAGVFVFFGGGLSLIELVSHKRNS